MSAEPPADNHALVGALRARIDWVLDPLVDPRYPVALLDFPDHGNPGDAAIWLGTTTWLRRRGAEVVYLCDWRGWSPRALKRRIGKGTILLHGGGNFGDLYPEHADFREQVIRTLPDQPVVLLPQSLELSIPATLERRCRFLAAHPKVHALGRDQPSYEILAGHLGARAHLCPDMAFTLSPPPAAVAPDHDVVRVARTDKEARSDPVDRAQADELVTDWIDVSWKRRHRRLRVQGAQRAADLSRALASVRPYDANARHVLRHGLKVVARGRVVTSDRLHVHILSVLMGRPHVSLDNSYGKLAAFRETWTADARLMETAQDFGESRAKAEALLAATR